MSKQAVCTLLVSVFAVVILLSPGLYAVDGMDGFDFGGDKKEEPVTDVKSTNLDDHIGKVIPKDTKKSFDLSADNFIRILLGNIIGPNFTEEVVDDNAGQILKGKHPAQKVVDAFKFFQKDKMDTPEFQKANILVSFRVALKREPTASEFKIALKLVQEEGIESLVEKLFNDPSCLWKGKYGKAVVEGAGLAGKIGKIASTFPSKYPSAGSFPYAPGTENGNLGCANVVSACLKEAGVKIPIILGVDGVKAALLALPAPQKFTVVNPPPYKAGDVVIWSAPAGSIHGHIGIVAKNGNTLEAMNNSSSQRHPIFAPMEYRPIASVLRVA